MSNNPSASLQASPSSKVVNRFKVCDFAATNAFYNHDFRVNFSIVLSPLVMNALVEVALARAAIAILPLLL